MDEKYPDAINVGVVEWTDEFKLRQRDRPSRTNTQSILYRTRLRRHYVRPDELRIPEMLQPMPGEPELMEDRTIVRYKLDISEFEGRDMTDTFEPMLEQSLQRIFRLERFNRRRNDLFVRLRWHHDTGRRFANEWSITYPFTRGMDLGDLVRQFFEYLFGAPTDAGDSRNPNALAGYLVIEVIVIHNARSYSHGNRPILFSFDRGPRSSSIVVVKSEDACAFHAVVIGIARVFMLTEEGDSKTEAIKTYSNMIKHQPFECKLLKNMSNNLSVGTGILVGPIENSVLPRFQRALDDWKRYTGKIQLNLVDEENNELVTSYAPYPGDDRRCIYLRYTRNGNNKGHMDLITNMRGYKRQDFCHLCKETYDSRSGHSRCAVRACKHCSRDHQDYRVSSSSGYFKCDACTRIFTEESCFNVHQLYYCQYSRCNECLRYYYSGRNSAKHICGQWYCNQCKEYDTIGSNHGSHVCYWKVPTKSKPRKDKKYAVIDIETRRHDNNDVIPELIWIVWGEGEDECKGFRRMDEFISFIFGKPFDGFTFWAHNGSGFDFRLIRTFLIDNGIHHDVSKRGDKLFRMAIGNRLFIDSMRHIPGSLRKIAKSFGLKLIKGHFPHLLFSNQFQPNVIDGMPDIKYFEPDDHSVEERNELYEWYAGEKKWRDEARYEPEPLTYPRPLIRRYQYDTLQQLNEYCKNDCKVLFQIVTLYRKMCLENFDEDPCNFITLPQMVMHVYKKQFMLPRTIAMVSSKWHSVVTQAEIDYIRYISCITSTDIWHAKSEGAEQPSVWLMDHKVVVTGKSDDEDSIVYDYLPCYANGCPRCYPLDRTEEDPKSRSTFESRYHLFEQKAAAIATKYHYIVTWECDFEKVKQMDKLETDEQVKEWQQYLFQQRFLFEALDPIPYPEWYKYTNHDPFRVTTLRDVVEGGNTSVGWMIRKLKEDEFIVIEDVTSMYPSVMLEEKFPVGLPKILKDVTKEMYLDAIGTPREYFGLIQCVILPPQHLVFPVLGVKHQNKRIPVLCRTCMEESSASSVPITPRNEFEDCKHTNEQRQISGFWGTVEVNLAIEAGYTLVKVFEVHHFEQHSRSVFAKFVEHMYKGKTYNSGYKDMKELKELIEKMREKYPTIELDETKFSKEKNAVLRELFKLIMNSLFGKFLQRRDFTEYKTIFNSGQYRKMIHEFGSRYHIIPKESYSRSELFEMTKKMDFLDQPNMTTNEYYGAMVTIYARCRLWRILVWESKQQKERMKQAQPHGEWDIQHPELSRVMYTDTDSAHRIYSKDEERYPTNEVLGGVKVEGLVRREVVVGPKFYGYERSDKTQKIWNADTQQYDEQLEVTIHAKGVVKTYNNEKKLTLNRLEELARGEDQEEELEFLDVYQDKEQVKMTKTKKKISRQYTKGHLVLYENGDIQALPFGYCYDCRMWNE